MNSLPKDNLLAKETTSTNNPPSVDFQPNTILQPNKPTLSIYGSPYHQVNSNLSPYTPFSTQANNPFNKPNLPPQGQMYFHNPRYYESPLHSSTVKLDDNTNSTAPHSASLSSTKPQTRSQSISKATQDLKKVNFNSSQLTNFSIPPLASHLSAANPKLHSANLTEKTSDILILSGTNHISETKLITKAIEDKSTVMTRCSEFNENIRKYLYNGDSNGYHLVNILKKSCPELSLEDSTINQLQKNLKQLPEFNNPIPSLTKVSLTDPEKGLELQTNVPIKSIPISDLNLGKSNTEPNFKPSQEQSIPFNNADAEFQPSLPSNENANLVIDKKSKIESSNFSDSKVQNNISDTLELETPSSTKASVREQGVNNEESEAEGEENEEEDDGEQEGGDTKKENTKSRPKRRRNASFFGRRKKKAKKNTANEEVKPTNKDENNKDDVAIEEDVDVLEIEKGSPVEEKSNSPPPVQRAPRSAPTNNGRERMLRSKKTADVVHIELTQNKATFEASKVKPVNKGPSKPISTGRKLTSKSPPGSASPKIKSTNKTLKKQDEEEILVKKVFKFDALTMAANIPELDHKYTEFGMELQNGEKSYLVTNESDLKKKFLPFSEEEVQFFEIGLKNYGKNFPKILENEFRQGYVNLLKREIEEEIETEKNGLNVDPEQTSKVLKKSDSSVSYAAAQLDIIFLD
ncbi:hypothetical protein HK099_006927 [Clydaea vesicula]|uniref:Uncharacterized protein n=1 Tax=Clydaea vesicula TaxID=447962 RepID=A0AAD5TZH4_9FUNG|nr:hypothetical protein HK099_006927 [Clydaea vesicula]